MAGMPRTTSLTTTGSREAEAAMLHNAITVDAAQFVERVALVQIIDSGTISQLTTDNFCPGPTGSSGPVGTPPGAVVDSADITEVTTDVFPINPPTPLSWPHLIYGGYNGH